MRRGSPWRETVAIIAAAVIAAAVSNALAGSERRLRWIGSYGEAPRPAAPAASPTASAPASGSSASVTPSGAAVAGGKEFASHPDKAWVEISGDDVAALHARGNVLFLDARRSSVYRDGHVAGARSVSVWEADVDDKVRGLFSEGRDQSAPIVVYCSGGDCEDSHMLGQKLYFVGFDNVLVYKDGFPDWQKRGLPVTKGDAP
jgi:rhodanese-related sulfurtransferase